MININFNKKVGDGDAWYLKLVIKDSIQDISLKKILL